MAAGPFRNNPWLIKLAMLTAILSLAPTCTSSTPAPTAAGATTPPTAKPPPKPDAAAQAIIDRNQAESLLYDLVKSDKDVGGILIIKHADAPAHDLIQEIAKFCAAVQKQLDAFAAADKSLHLDQTGLPPMELQARKSEGSATSKELFGHSGREFEARLLLSQVKAVEYAMHLCDVATAVDKDPARQAMLKEWSKSFGRLRERGLALLAQLPAAPK